jgi:dihydrofolate synthase/folylpolyglutamate synthase
MAMLLAGLPKAFDYDRLLVVLAVSNDKDIKQMLETLGANAHKLILTQNTSYRSASVNQLNDIAMSVTNSYSIEADLEKAIDKAVSMAGARDLVCITGSLYTVADAREILVNKRMSYKSTAQELFEPV